ncbi:MAG: ABC transporter substrate-binding protein [Candidatus Nanopelagicales bacterium]
MRSRATVVLAISAGLALAACTGAPPPTDSGSASVPTDNFTILTPAPTGDAGALTWATYRETQTLDPIQAFDYPENTVDSILCDALLRQAPDMTIGPGLTKLTTVNPTTLDFVIQPGAKFWDGTPVTADDVVFSLKRAADPQGVGFYSSVFSRVKSITAKDSSTVEILLDKPDQWLPGELSATPGMVVKKSFVEQAGDKFGTVQGGTMCSGPFKLDSWKTGSGVVVVPNTDYWDSSLPKPKVSKITLIGVSDDAALTAGLQTGTISGVYLANPLATLGQLRSSADVKVYQGPPYATDAMVVSATKGPLADPRVRQAISYALDRKGIISTLWKGAALIPHALEAQGTWGYAQDVFKSGYEALPALEPDLTKAQDLIKQAGVAGQSIKIGTSSGSNAINAEALAYKAAAEKLGLKVEFNDVSPDNFINFFIDPKAWGSVDAFPTTNYGDYADPAALYRTLALPGGSQNFSNWNDPATIAALENARSEADPAKRAQYVVDAQKTITEQMVWIPTASPNAVLVMHKGITGAPSTFSYMFGPWAVYLGAG